MSPTDLESLVTTLRRLGVRQYTDGGVSLTLDAAPLAPPAAVVGPSAVACICGHPEEEHNDLGCLSCVSGCGPVKPKVTTTPG